jgi:hypothetical protein
MNSWVSLTEDRRWDTFVVGFGLLLDGFVEGVFEGGEPIGIEFLLDVPVDVVQHLLHVLDRGIKCLLLGDHLLLSACPHQRRLLD